MFTSPYSPRSASQPRRGSLYQQVGVETRISSATPHQLVAMLFDGYMVAIAQARGALRHGDTQAKGQAIGRAVAIIEEGLRAGLNLSAGGSLAQDLDELYSWLTMRLTMANLRNDDAMLDECQRLVRPLQEAWTAIGEDPRTRG